MEGVGNGMGSLTVPDTSVLFRGLVRSSGEGWWWRENEHAKERKRVRKGSSA